MITLKGLVTFDAIKFQRPAGSPKTWPKASG
jgi:hypothetical protein